MESWERIQAKARCDDEEVMERAKKFWGQLIAGVMCGLLGIVTILTKHIGSSTVREMQTNGPAAQFVGVLLIIISMILLTDWIKTFRASRRQ